MTQKHIIGLALGVLGIVLAFAFVYRQFTAPVPRTGTLQREEQPNASDAMREKKAALPETIDDISASIQEEISADLSALDDEANGEVLEIEADSDSITNLGTSYDENSL